MPLKDRLALAMSRKPHLRPADVARACEVSTASVADWQSGETKSLKPKSARLAAALFGCSQAWIGEGVGLPNWTDTQHPPAGDDRPTGAQAHLVSQPPYTSSPHLNWGEIMSTQPLPGTFRVAVPDDAMAPQVRAGQIVEFSTGLGPRPGDGVLVADSAGALYFRVYRTRRADQWEAHPLNDAYRPLDSHLDGLRVLAVLTAVHARWGAA